MRFDEFEEQYLRLKGAYGERVFNLERQKTFWEVFRLEQAVNMKAALDIVIAEKTTAPAASDIKAAMGFKKREQHRPVYDWDCAWCGQDGRVTFRNVPENGYGSLYRCPCEFGKKWGDDYPDSDLRNPMTAIDIWAKGSEANSQPWKIPHKVILR